MGCQELDVVLFRASPVNASSVAAITTSRYSRVRDVIIHGRLQLP